MANAGVVVGYIFALLTLVSALPLMLILVRIWRRQYSSKKDDLFELKLSRSAKNAMEKRRFGVLEKRRSNSTQQFLSDVQEGVSKMRGNSATALDKSVLVDDLVIDADFSLHIALRDQHAYFGIKDLFLAGGVVSMLGTSVTLPLGLVEDFLFYACNNLNPLPFAFSDDLNPSSLLSRYVVYCNSQIFALTVYLVINEDARIVVNIFLSPLVLLCEFWLSRLIACPCLQRSPGNTDKKEKDQVETYEVWAKRVLRVAGGVLSLPLLLLMIFLIVILAIGLANDTIKGELLGRFVLDGIILPFLMKLGVVFFSFCYPLHPHHVNVCGVNVFKVNHWTELQYHEEDMSSQGNLSAEEIKKQKVAHWQKSFGEASIFHMNCYCLRYIGLATDPHYRLDVCHPSCYFSRCCNAIGECCYEVPEHKRQYQMRKLRSESDVASPLPAVSPGLTSVSGADGAPVDAMVMVGDRV